MSSEERRKIILNFDRLIQSKTPGNCDAISARLGVSRRTLFRLITYIREELNAPLVYDEKDKRYKYAQAGSIVFNFVKQ